jgi:hypothetical protein
MRDLAAIGEELDVGRGTRHQRPEIEALPGEDGRRMSAVWVWRIWSTSADRRPVWACTMSA